MPTLDHIRWPLRTFPVCFRGGAFPMTVPGCNVTYRHPTLALHLHDYGGVVWIGPRRITLEPGDITLSPGGKIPTRYALKESGQHLCLHIQWPDSGGTATAGVPVLSGFAPANRKPPANARYFTLPLHLRPGPAVAEARARIWRVIDHQRLAGPRENSPAACAASAALQELLLWLQLQGERTTGPHRGSSIEQALQRLEKNIEASLTKPMLLEELAAGTGLSTDYIARAFARRYGMRLQHYLLLRRIELARHLLISSDLPVAAIGRQVGLPDPQYFNKQFRRIANVSPLAYRTRHVSR